MTPALWSAGALAAASDSGNKIVITYAHWGNNSWIEDRIKAFNASQDRIEVKFSPNYPTPANFAAGVTADVFTTAITYMGGLADDAAGGFIEDLTPLVQRDASDLHLDQMAKFAQAISQVNGRWYGLPFLVYAGETIIYNKGLLAQSGLDDPPADWTLSQYVAMAKKLTKDTNGDGKFDQWGAENQGITLSHYKQAYLFNPDGTRFLGDDPALLGALQFMQNMYQTWGVVGGSMVGCTPIGFSRAKSNWLPYLVSHANGKCDYGLQLAPIDPQTGTRGQQLPNGNFISMSSHLTPQKQAAAWEFMKYFMSDAAVQAVNSAEGYMQAFPPYPEQEQKYYFHPTNPAYKDVDLSIWLDNLPNVVSRFDYAKTNRDQITSIINAGVSKIETGALSAQSFLQQATPEINGILAGQK